jgi:hypothetical protein
VSKGSNGKISHNKHPIFEYPPVSFNVDNEGHEVICHCPECTEEREHADKKMDALAIFEAVLEQKK